VEELNFEPRLLQGPACGDYSVVFTLVLPSVGMAREFNSNEWSFGDGQSATGTTTSREHTYAKPGNYPVKGELCAVSDTVNVLFVECESELEIPNVFTPNGDGVNETFEVKGIFPGKWQLVVINRFGKEVYRNTGYSNNWNGNELPAGVYYYHLQDRDTKRRYRGWVQIIR